MKNSTRRILSNQTNNQIRTLINRAKLQRSIIKLLRNHLTIQDRLHSQQKHILRSILLKKSILITRHNIANTENRSIKSFIISSIKNSLFRLKLTNQIRITLKLLIKIQSILIKNNIFSTRPLKTSNRQSRNMSQRN